MTLDEYGKLLFKPEVIQTRDLHNQVDRTLLYGYTTERDTWHVYLLNKEIFCVRYEYKKSPVKMIVVSDVDYIPNKRLYPSMCDYEFCKLLSDRGVSLPFTIFTEVAEQTFYGDIL